MTDEQRQEALALLNTMSEEQLLGLLRVSRGLQPDDTMLPWTVPDGPLTCEDATAMRSAIADAS